MDKEKIKQQIIKVQQTGRTNMLDTNAVQVIANEMGLYELVCFIEDEKKAYANFVMKGRFED